VEELENRKIHLIEKCTAHKEENLEISRMLAVFIDKHDALRSWLTGVAEGFLQSHQDMGSDLAMACDFRRVHCQLLTDLENKNEEVDHLELEILPIIGRLDESQRYEAQLKVKKLEDDWTKTKITVAKRIELGTIYIQFHEIVEELTKEMDSIDNELKKYEDAIDEAKIHELERRWKCLEPLYKKLDCRAKAFLDETSNVSYKILLLIITLLIINNVTVTLINNVID